MLLQNKLILRSNWEIHNIILIWKILEIGSAEGLNNSLSIQNFGEFLTSDCASA